jgi:hypothetical protein
VIIEYSDEYIRYIYKDIYGNSVQGDSGVYSEKIKLDKDRNPVANFKYDKDNKLTEDNNGVAQYLWTVDRDGRRITSIRIKANGEKDYR